MENKKCFYLVEGECEEKLLKALIFMVFLLSACAGRGNTNGNQKTSESTDPVSGSFISKEPLSNGNVTVTI